MAFIGEQEKTDIISSKSYLGTMLLGIFPIVGDILLIKWLRDTENVRENKRNMCLAYIKLKLMIIYPVWLISIIMSVYIGNML